MKYLPSNHTFAVCAYKESIFLEECILSLKQQTVKSNIIMCTSTPNEYIENLAGKYHIRLFINKTSGGIASDWNFAYKSAETVLVTLAHQDDVYEPEYLENMLAGMNSGNSNILIGFTDYYEIQNRKKVDSKQFLNLRIKRLLLFPLRSKILQSSIWVRRRILSLGDPIGCPSVTYVKSNLPETVFQSHFQAALDWQTWGSLSKRKGRFLYVSKSLMGHRMYEESTTVKMINENGRRAKEDYEMFKEFWPEPIAKLICRLYVKSQKRRFN